MANTYFCNDCHIQFKCQQNLDIHLSTEKHFIRSSVDKTSNKLFVCKKCQKSFLYSSGLSKHRNKCTSIETQPLEMVELIAHHKQEKEKLLQENEKMKKKINELLENNKTTNVTNNIENQTININYYGRENVSYITDSFVEQHMTSPYNIIPGIIQQIHFHPKHPENHNVKITNKKLPYASVYKNDKWELDNKTKIIRELAIKGHDIMNEHITNFDKLTDAQQECFHKFQEKFINDDPNARKQIYNDTEMVILNGSKTNSIR